MSTPGRGSPRILLKARPLPQQLADRLAPPAPDGMELYIHEADVAGDGWLETLGGRIGAVPLPDPFTWIVEGPVWSLDGELFGICRDAPVDRELTRRLVRLATAIGAVAVNVHCVDGSYDPAVLSEARRVESLQRAQPYLRWYVRLCQDAGLTPLIENVPPICRMRREALVYTPIGVEPEDLLACVEAAPGLRLTLDTSHAQLAVNALRGVPPPPALPALASLLARPAAYYRERGGGRGAGRKASALGGGRGAGRKAGWPGGASTLDEYCSPLLPHVESVHVSNAAGLLDEGLPYDEGDADLDGAVRRLAPHTRYFVTEPLDPDENRAVLKRQMQASLGRVLGR